MSVFIRTRRFRQVICVLLVVVLCAIIFFLYRHHKTAAPQCTSTQATCVTPTVGDGKKFNSLTVPVTTLQGGTGTHDIVPLGTLLFGAGTDTLTQLSIGTEGQVLTVRDGVPAWGPGSTVSVVNGGNSTSIIDNSSGSGSDFNADPTFGLVTVTRGMVLNNGAPISTNTDQNLILQANGAGQLVLGNNIVSMSAGSTSFRTDTATTTVLTLENAGSGVENLNLADGNLQTDGITRLTNAGALQNITGLTVNTGVDQRTPVATLGNTTGSTAIYTTNATPEGDITAAVGALAIDHTSGTMYIKTSGSGNTGWTQFGTSGGCSATGCTFTSSGTNAIVVSGVNGGLSISSNGNGTLSVDSGSTGAVNVGTGAASKTVTVGNTTGTSAVVVNTGSGKFTVNGAGVFNGSVTQSGDLNIGGGKFTVNAADGSLAVSTNKFTVNGTTGAVTIAGATTIAGPLTNGAQTYTALPVSDVAAGGAIGTAAATVDAYSAFNLSQTTAGQTITLPSPTNTASGHIAYLTNNGSAAFTFYGQVVAPGAATEAIWNGAAWALVGSGTVTSACTATGCTFTSTGTNTVSVSGTNGGLTLNANGSGVVSLDSGTTGAVNIGTGANSKTITVGNTTGTTGVMVNTGSNGLTINGNSTLNGSLTQTGNLDIGTAKFTVAAADGSIAVNSNKFTVNGTTGAVAIAGATTIAGGLTSGAQTYTSLNLGNFAAGGAIGTAAATVDVSSSFNIAQTTAGQTLTLPSPTVNTSGRVAYVTNNGSTSFSFYGLAVSPGTSAEAIWNGTWNLVGSGTVAAACTATGCTFTSTGTNTISVSGINGGLSLDANGTGSIAIGTGSTGGVTIGATSNTTTVGGDLSANGNVTLGTDATKTVTVNGKIASTVDLNNNLLVNIGNAGTDFTSGGGLTMAGTLITNGAQSFGAVAIANLAAGGTIGTAATTVDIASNFAVNQTTAAQTITLPNPTVATAGRIAYVGNVGTTSFSFYGQTVGAGQSVQALWNGSAWTLVGTPAVASVCTTSGCTFTSTGTNTVGVSGVNGGLTLNSNGTGVVNLDSGTTGAVNIGTNANAKAVTIGNTTGASAVVVNTGSGKFTVNGASTLNGTLGTTGNLTVGTNMLTVAAADGSIAVNSNKFTVNGTTGAVAIAGTVTNGSQTYTTLLLANLASGGAIGTAAATVDQYSSFKLPQTTAGQTITLPSPTTTTAGKVAYITNTGSAAFSFYGLSVASAAAAEAIWDGAAWNLVGAATVAGACTSTGCTFTSTGTNTINVSGVNGGLTLNSNGTGVVNVDSGTTGAVNIGTNANAKTVTIGNTTGASAVVVNAGSGKFTVNGATTLNGTLTGTGNVDIGTGKFTVAASDGSIVINTNKILLNGTSGDVFIAGTTTANGNLKNGAQSYISSGFGNYPTGGNIGTAATTVDLYSAFTVIQTTAGQTLTLPTPTSSVYGRIAYITNNGSAAFTFYGLTVNPGASAEAMWNGTAWNLVGSGTVASACTTTGCTFTSTGTNAITVSGTDGGLTLNSNGTGAVNVDSGTTGAVNIGTNANAKAVTIGNTTGASAVVVNTGSGNLTVNGNSILNGTLTGTGNMNIGGGKFTVAAADGSIAVNTNKFTVNGTTGAVAIAGALVSGAHTYTNMIIADLPAGGAIGTAATTVDLYSSFSIGQTTAGQTITLPAPSVTSSGHVAYVTNAGSTSFSFYGLTVGSGTSAEVIWDATLASWTLLGSAAGASACTTSGCTFTSTGTNTISVSGTNGGLTLNSNANGVVNLDSGTTGAINIGTNANAKTLTFGNATGNTSVVINSGSAGLAFNTASNGNIVFSPNGIGLTIFGTVSNGLTISSAGVVNYTGTSRPTTHVSLTPEYPGAVLTPSGTNNTGTMTSDYCSNGLAVNITICPTAGNIHSYYSWTTTAGTAQNYDVYMQYKLPLNFSAFSGTFKTFAWRTGASDSVVVNLYNGSTACGTFTATATNTTWTQGTVTPTCSPVAGDTLTIKVSLIAVNGEFARAGEIDFDYLGKY